MAIEDLSFEELFEIFGYRTADEVIPPGTHRHMYTRNGVSEYWYNNGDRLIEHRYHHTAEAVMEANKEAAKEFSRTGRLNVNTHVAAIPASVYADLQKSGITDDTTDFTKWLNASDNAMWRSNNLRV